MPSHSRPAPSPNSRATAIPAAIAASGEVETARGTFAADWCRALEIHVSEFARLRAWQLGGCAGTSVFEDLMGYSLPASYVPAL